MFPESQIVPAHFDFDRVTQRREADQFDGGANQQTHFHKARPAFGRKFYFGDGCGSAQCDRGQRLKGGGHGVLEIKSVIVEKVEPANCYIGRRRAPSCGGDRFHKN